MTAAVTGHRRRMVRLVSIETAAKKRVFPVLGGRSVGTARYGQTLEVHSTFLPRPLGTRGRRERTAEWRERPEKLRCKTLDSLDYQ